MALSEKCKNCKHKSWACPGWMCSNEKHPNFDPEGDTPNTIHSLDATCDLFEESANKIYVAVFNYFGDYTKLAERYAGCELVNGDTLCFCNIKGEWIAAQMEKDGCDYNYSCESPEAAWKKETE